MVERKTEKEPMPIFSWSQILVAPVIEREDGLIGAPASPRCDRVKESGEV